MAALDGGFVLTGSKGGAEPTCCLNGEPDMTPAAWLSLDGHTWRAATVDAPADLRTEIGRVFVGRGGLAAWSLRGDGFAWVSLDGRRWATLPNGSRHPVFPWVSDGRRIIGRAHADDGRPAYLVSGDGATWRTLASTGQVDEAPWWDSTDGAVADDAWLSADGVGLVGQDGTASEVCWFAKAASVGPP